MFKMGPIYCSLLSVLLLVDCFKKLAAAPQAKSNWKLHIASFCTKLFENKNTLKKIPWKNIIKLVLFSKRKINKQHTFFELKKCDRKNERVSERKDRKKKNREYKKATKCLIVNNDCFCLHLFLVGFLQSSFMTLNFWVSLVWFFLIFGSFAFLPLHLSCFFQLKVSHTQTHKIVIKCAK